MYNKNTYLFLPVQVPLANRRELEMLRELLDYMAVRYKEKTSVGFASARMGMSRSRFHSFFRSQTGMTWVAYINKVRLEHAARLLVETDQKSEVIGFDCGFDSPSHFYQCFKEQYGVSPAQFKERLRGRGEQSGK